MPSLSLGHDPTVLIEIASGIAVRPTCTFAGMKESTEVASDSIREESKVEPPILASLAAWPPPLDSPSVARGPSDGAAITGASLSSTVSAMGTKEDVHDPESEVGMNAALTDPVGMSAQRTP